MRIFTAKQLMVIFFIGAPLGGILAIASNYLSLGQRAHAARAAVLALLVGEGFSIVATQGIAGGRQVILAGIAGLLTAFGFIFHYDPKVEARSLEVLPAHTGWGVVGMGVVAFVVSQIEFFFTYAATSGLWF